MGFHRGPKTTTNGLVTYLDAGNTKSYPGSGTSWVDISRNGNDSTLVNGPIFDPSNVGSIEFNSNDQYAISDLPNISSEHTVFLWIYPTNPLPLITGDSTGRVTPLKGNGSWNPGIWLGSNKIRVHVNGKFADYTSLNWTESRWYMIGQVWNGTELNIILDGKVTVPTSTNNYSAGVPTQLLLGNESAASTVYAFPGNISGVKIYNKALTSNEISSEYNAIKSRYNL